MVVILYGEHGRSKGDAGLHLVNAWVRGSLVCDGEMMTSHGNYSAGWVRGSLDGGRQRGTSGGNRFGCWVAKMAAKEASLKTENASR
jgi:hypothetical protein